MALDSQLLSFLADNIPLDYYKKGRLDLSKLCEKLDIDVFDADFTNDKISGAIENKDKKWTIYVNNSDSAPRKRFTVAHELGHYFSYIYGSHSKQEIDNNEGVMQDFAFSRSMQTDMSKPAEVEANQIAAHILMPATSVKQLAEDNNTEEMAEYFGVSESAMTFRLKNLGYRLLEEFGEAESPVCPPH